MVNIGGPYIGYTQSTFNAKELNLKLNGSLSTQLEDTASSDLSFDGSPLFNSHLLHGLEIGLGGMKDNLAGEISISFCSGSQLSTIESPYKLLTENLQETKVQASLGIGKQGLFWGAWSGVHLGWVTHQILISENHNQQEAYGIPEYNITTESAEEDPALVSNRFRTGIKAGIWFGGQTGLRFSGEIGTDFQGLSDQAFAVSLYSNQFL